MTGTEKRNVWDKLWRRMYYIDTAIMRCEAEDNEADMLDSLLIESYSLNLELEAMYRDGWGDL